MEEVRLYMILFEAKDVKPSNQLGCTQEGRKTNMQTMPSKESRLHTRRPVNKDTNDAGKNSPVEAEGLPIGPTRLTDEIHETAWVILNLRKRWLGDSMLARLSLQYIT